MEEYLGHYDLRTCHCWIFIYGVMLNLWCILANVEQLKEKIITVFATLKLQNTTFENVHRDLIRRAQLCMQQHEHHFQQFLNEKNFVKSRHSVPSRTNIGNVYKC